MYKRQVLEGVEFIQLDIDDLLLAPAWCILRLFRFLRSGSGLHRWSRFFLRLLFDRLFRFLCGGFGPVSYTHLDVYKRQALDHLGGFGVNQPLVSGFVPKIAVNDRACEVLAGLASVSYTHLCDFAAGLSDP